MNEATVCLTLLILCFLSAIAVVIFWICIVQSSNRRFILKRCPMCGKLYYAPKVDSKPKTCDAKHMLQKRNALLLAAISNLAQCLDMQERVEALGVENG